MSKIVGFWFSTTLRTFEELLEETVDVFYIKYIKISKTKNGLSLKFNHSDELFAYTIVDFFFGHSACLLKKFRLLEYYENLVTFNRNSLICQTTAKTFFDYFGVILMLFSNVKLQFTCKKPTEQRIRSLLRVFFQRLKLLKKFGTLHKKR